MYPPTFVGGYFFKVKKLKIELMDINLFVEKRKLKEVKSAKIEGRGGRLDSEGLFSEGATRS